MTAVLDLGFEGCVGKGIYTYTFTYNVGYSFVITSNAS